MIIKGFNVIIDDFLSAVELQLIHVLRLRDNVAVSAGTLLCIVCEPLH